MNKTELINKVSEKSGLTKKDSDKAINALIETVTETLKCGNDLQLIKFGSFQVKQISVRTGRNPKISKEIEMAAADVPSFKAGKVLKETVK